MHEGPHSMLGGSPASWMRDVMLLDHVFDVIRRPAKKVVIPRRGLPRVVARYLRDLGEPTEPSAAG
jgi:hypothetical protein